jgi:hypothetical protein
MIDAIPPERTHDVCYFNVTDTEFPVGFNPLARLPRQRHALAPFILLLTLLHFLHMRYPITVLARSTPPRAGCCAMLRPAGDTGLRAVIDKRCLDGERLLFKPPPAGRTGNGSSHEGASAGVSRFSGFGFLLA